MDEYTFKDLSFIPEIKSIAVIGASRKRDFYFLRIYLERFKGRIYCINPIIKKIEDLPYIPVYKSLTDIPDDEPVDFVFITVTRERVIQAIDDCVAKGVKLASVFTSDFADEGTEEGIRLQKELITHIKGDLRIIGPNGMGLYFPKIGIRWRSSLPLVTKGNVGIIAQSGGLCNLIIHGLYANDINVSKAFSIGNAVDVNLLDGLKFLKDDPETKVIVAYIEGLPEGTGKIFIKLVQECQKPVLILKAGKTDVGAKAAISHTASLIGDYSIWASAIKQAGGILLDTLNDIINMVKFLTMIGKKKIDNVCLISLSGGYGVICSDNLVDNGFNLPLLQNDTKTRFDDIFSDVHGSSYNNPIDVAILLYDPKKMGEIISTVMKFEIDKGLIDIIIFEIAPLYLAYQLTTRSKNLTDSIFNELKNIKEQFPNKPIITIIQDIGFNEVNNYLIPKLHSIGIPVYADINPVIRTFKALKNIK